MTKLPFSRYDLAAAAKQVGLTELPAAVPASMLPTYLNAAIVFGFAAGTLKDGEPNTEVLRAAVQSLRHPPHVLQFSLVDRAAMPEFIVRRETVYSQAINAESAEQAVEIAMHQYADWEHQDTTIDAEVYE